MKNKTTIKDLEAKTGKPNSIRKPTGKNPRSDMHVDTYVKEFQKRIPQMVLPDTLPTSVTLTYDDGRTLVLEDTKLAALVLNFAGLLK